MTTIIIRIMFRLLDNYNKINNIKRLITIIDQVKRNITMPIFEFRCLKCNECFELLVMNNDDQVMRCPECKSEDFERVLSASCYSMGSGSSESQGAQSKTRSCPSGTCTTYDIPGPPK